MPDQDTWVFINTFAPWLAGIGTLLAVIVALKLARSERKVCLNVNAGIATRTRISGMPEEIEEVVIISATNEGYRKARVTLLYWKVGFLKKATRIQLPFLDDPYSHQLPVNLADGETAQWHIPLSIFANSIREFFPNKFVRKHPALFLRTLKIGIKTITGCRFERKIERGLRGWILQEYLQQREKS